MESTADSPRANRYRTVRLLGEDLCIAIPAGTPQIPLPAITLTHTHSSVIGELIILFTFRSTEGCSGLNPVLSNVTGCQGSPNYRSGSKQCWCDDGEL